MNAEKTPLLSKTRFLAGLQCPLRLYHECYDPELASEVSPVQQAIFDMGHEVGRLATQLYPGGIRIEEDHLHHEEAVRSTLRAMANENVRALYEAAFLSDGVRIRVDILERTDGGRWNLIEVKSSTSVKDIHIPDVAVQYHVLKEAGLDVDQVILMHLNNQYFYDGRRVELEQLFRRADMSKRALLYQKQIPSLLADFNDMMAKSEEPGIRPGRHCRTPYECEFWDHCTKDMPEQWVMHLAGITQKRLNELEALGIQGIRDIPASFALTALQDRIRRCVIQNEAYISGHLTAELKDVEHPVHFLDFETFGSAIPRYAGTRPYQPLPFQWSDHILYKDGTIEHWEYLCEKDQDPREEFALSLLDVLDKEGTIVTYTKYEGEVIKRLAQDLPHLCAPLVSTLDRIKDMHKIINRHYYHPQFHGSFSLKSVLPALLPEMSYDKLAVQEGQQAGLEYLRMIDPSTPPDEKERIKRGLLAYCGHDTLAMLRIREELLR